jgi:lipid-binding SYLF domain-containing protein
MKTIILTIVLMGFVAAASAIDKPELDGRIRKLTAKFEAMQRKPDKRIPAELLNKAKGIILLDRTKAGFLFAYEGGAGVAMVKDPKKDTWSPAAFLKADDASLGFQIGGQQTFYAILLMSTNATQSMANQKFSFGGEASGTAGTQSGGVGESVSSDEQPIVIFTDRQGLYGGATIKGGAISPDEEGNRVYYGQYLTVKDILFDKKVQPSQSTEDLAQKLTDNSKAEKK